MDKTIRFKMAQDEKGWYTTLNEGGTLGEVARELGLDLDKLAGQNHIVLQDVSNSVDYISAYQIPKDTFKIYLPQDFSPSRLPQERLQKLIAGGAVSSINLPRDARAKLALQNSANRFAEIDQFFKNGAEETKEFLQANPQYAQYYTDPQQTDDEVAAFAQSLLTGNSPASLQGGAVASDIVPAYTRIPQPQNPDHLRIDFGPSAGAQAVASVDHPEEPRPAEPVSAAASNAETSRPLPAVSVAATEATPPDQGVVNSSTVETFGDPGFTDVTTGFIAYKSRFKSEEVYRRVLRGEIDLTDIQEDPDNPNIKYLLVDGRSVPVTDIFASEEDYKIVARAWEDVLTQASVKFSTPKKSANLLFSKHEGHIPLRDLTEEQRLSDFRHDLVKDWRVCDFEHFDDMDPDEGKFFAYIKANPPSTTIAREIDFAWLYLADIDDPRLNFRDLLTIAKGEKTAKDILLTRPESTDPRAAAREAKWLASLDGARLAEGKPYQTHISFQRDYDRTLRNMTGFENDEGAYLQGRVADAQRELDKFRPGYRFFMNRLLNELQFLPDAGSLTAEQLPSEVVIVMNLSKTKDLAEVREWAMTTDPDKIVEHYEQIAGVAFSNEDAKQLLKFETIARNASQSANGKASPDADFSDERSLGQLATWIRQQTLVERERFYADNPDIALERSYAEQRADIMAKAGLDSQDPAVQAVSDDQLDAAARKAALIEALGLDPQKPEYKALSEVQLRAIAQARGL